MHLSPEEIDVIKAGLEHDVPGDCWATGPLTGDPIKDLIACPGCRALKVIEEAVRRASKEIDEFIHVECHGEKLHYPEER